MEAKCSSKTSVDFDPATLSYVSEDKSLGNYRCENIKAYKNQIH